MSELIRNVLSQDAFWILNKKITKLVGIEAAVLLSDLITKEAYFEVRNELNEEGYFFNTIENIEEDTTLTYHKQKKAIDVLKEHDLIDTKLKGVPAKLHFKICKTSIENVLKLDLEKFENLNSNNSKTFNKNKTNNNKTNNTLSSKANFAEEKDQEEIEFEEEKEFETVKVEIVNLKSCLEEKKKLAEVDEDFLNLFQDENERLYVEIAAAYLKLFKKIAVDRDAPSKELDEATFLWVDAVRKFMEIDGYKKEDLLDVYHHIRTNDFWQDNAKSLVALRKKRDGVMKIKTILLKARSTKKQVQQKAGITTSQELEEVQAVIDGLKK